MKTGKRIVSIFLVVLMLLTAAPLAVAETIDSGTCGDNLTWTLDSDGKLTITGSGAMQNTQAWSSHQRDIKSVSIGNSVTSIGDHAFSNCEYLTDVMMSNSVTSIGNSAFLLCGSLSSITIPDSVSNIVETAFAFCGLERFIVSANNSSFASDDYGCLYNKNKTMLIMYPAGNRRESFSVPEGVTSIGHFAFLGCDLKSVAISNDVKSIGAQTFNYCNNLVSITISDSVTDIWHTAFDDSPFYNNSANWENDVLYIGNHLIDVKQDLSGDCVVQEGTKTIANGAFRFCSNLTSVTIPDSVNRIGIQAFQCCESLTCVTIPESVTSIGSYAFDGCYRLTNVSISNSVTCIDDSTFNGCHSLTDLIIPDGVTSIGVNAFMGCVGLVNVTIPNSMLNISGGAFSNCNGITDVYYEGSEAQWNAITIDEYNECLTGATIHYKMEPHTHTAADPVCENEVEATCEGAGSYDEVVYCADCGEELSRETVTIPATDHDEGSDGYCVKCGQDLHPSERCKFCGKIHNGGFFDKLTGFFHKIFAIFKR